jgi:FkbM family methyltransferase
MIKKPLKMLQIAWWLRNAPEVYRHILSGHPLSGIQLRAGLLLKAPDNVNLWNHFNEIWFHKIYTGRGFEIKTGATVIDVGANIGLFSILAASKAARVYSFEPFPPTFDWLQRNIHENCLENITAYNYAVGAKPESRVLHVQPESTANSLFAGQDQTGGQEMVVKCTSLSEIFEVNNLEKVDFLKLDCEGSEFEIIFETPKEVLKKCDVIVMECHNGVTKFSHADISRHLEALGFVTEVAKLYGNTVIMRSRNLGIRS